METGPQSIAPQSTPPPLDTWALTPRLTHKIVHLYLWDGVSSRSCSLWRALVALAAVKVQKNVASPLDFADRQA